MENILSYIKWRKDISFLEKGFNEVDSLICALLGYVVWEGAVSTEEIYLNEACRKVMSLHTPDEMKATYAYSPMIAELIAQLCDTPRFNQVKLKKYESVFDENKDTQFAAITILIPDDIVYLSFRGTDSSILGWKEDFEMTFQEVVPSQIKAEDYLRRAVQDVVLEKKVLGFKRVGKIQKLYLGGHSKGGNLAMYAAYCAKEMQQHITRVDSFDGPGFRAEFYDKVDVRPVLRRIFNYLPKDSIIGRLLEHKEKYVILNAYESGLLQHDGFYWQVNSTQLERVENFSAESDRVKGILDKTLFSKTDSERKAFITFLFSVLTDMKISSITDFTEINWSQGLKGIKELAMMSAEDRKLFFEVGQLALEQSKAFLLSKMK